MYRMSFQVVTLFISAVAIACVSVRAEGQNLVSNGQFDAGIDGWTLTGGGPESAMAWDGGSGSPTPGSLRMSSTAQGPALEALGDCVNGIPEEVLSVTGRVMEPAAQLGVTCYVALIIYSDLDCTGTRTFTANVPPNTPGIWEDSGFAIQIPTAGISARPGLTMERSAAGSNERVCFFDSIIFESDLRGAPISDIPALSWPGFLVLILLVGTAALIRIQR